MTMWARAPNGIVTAACQGCAFYAPLSDALPLGQCRRRPPNANLSIGHKWPQVAADDWCGEFKDARIAEQEARTP